MALGTVKGRNNKRDIEIMSAVSANNSPPATSLAGVPVYPRRGALATTAGDEGAMFPGQPASKSRLIIASTAGSGVLVGTFTLWGFLETAAKWVPIKVNAGAALAETATDSIGYTEVFDLLSAFDRLYLEVSAIGGTGTTFSAWLVSCQEAY